jgi:predicted CXXCH cytochrome family protein
VKTPNILKLIAAALFLVATTASAQITDSDHNFIGTGWNATGEICIVCHAAHNNNNAGGELLWNHTLSGATYVVYDSPTFSQTAANPPSGASKLCLSCHDGTVSLDSFGGGANSGAGFINGGVEGGTNFGTDLSNDHPISFAYVTGAGEELSDITTGVTFGDATTGTIADMLFGDQVECSSCHDVHNTKSGNNSTLLLIDNDASALCLTCHQK